MARKKQSCDLHRCSLYPGYVMRIHHDFFLPSENEEEEEDGVGSVDLKLLCDAFCQNEDVDLCEAHSSGGGQTLFLITYRVRTVVHGWSRTQRQQQQQQQQQQHTQQWWTNDLTANRFVGRYQRQPGHPLALRPDGGPASRGVAQPGPGQPHLSQGGRRGRGLEAEHVRRVVVPLYCY